MILVISPASPVGFFLFCGSARSRAGAIAPLGSKRSALPAKLHFRKDN